MTLIERAAEAIWREDRALTGKMGLQWKNVTTGEKAYYRTFARAVLQAIREPMAAELRGRIDYATGQFNNAREWPNEKAPDGNGSLLDWICRAVALEEGLPTDLP